MKKALELETLEKGFSALAHIQKLEQQIKQLKELLQYVANEHLCGTPLLEGMKKQGIEYNKPDKKALKK
jgi:hypothetical protein